MNAKQGSFMSFGNDDKNMQPPPLSRGASMNMPPFFDQQGLEESPGLLG